MRYSSSLVDRSRPKLSCVYLEGYRVRGTALQSTLRLTQSSTDRLNKSLVGAWRSKPTAYIPQLRGLRKIVGERLKKKKCKISGLVMQNIKYISSVLRRRQVVIISCCGHLWKQRRVEYEVQLPRQLPLLVLPMKCKPGEELYTCSWKSSQIIQILKLKGPTCSGHRACGEVQPKQV